MRRTPLASVFLLFGLATHAAEVRPAPRLRLTSEMVAAVTGQSRPTEVKPAPETTPVLLVDSAVLASRVSGEAVQMAPFVISEPRMKLPAPTQVPTSRGRLDHALQRRPGLRFLSFWGLNNKVGLAMLEEDRAYQRNREMADLWALTLIK